MSESDKKTSKNLIHLDLLSNFYISIDNNEEEHDEVLEEEEPIIVINNIDEINTIYFNFKKPVKINKYDDIDESITYPIHSFVIFARNKKTDEWNLIFYKEDSNEYTYSNFENKYKYYKWNIISL
jgi:hypothetical protein